MLGTRAHTSFQSNVEERLKALPWSQFEFVYDVSRFQWLFQKLNIFPFYSIWSNNIENLWKFDGITDAIRMPNSSLTEYIHIPKLTNRLDKSHSIDSKPKILSHFLFAMRSSILPHKFANQMAFQWCAMWLIWYLHKRTWHVQMVHMTISMHNRWNWITFKGIWFRKR